MNQSKWDAVYAAALVQELRGVKKITETVMKNAIEQAKAIADYEQEVCERIVQDAMSSTLLRLRLGKHGS